jgi:cytochrome c-type biogenesis protein CcmH
VRKTPDDGQAWANLGEANKAKGDLPASIAAYKKAIALLPNNARVLADYAEALAIAANGRFQGQPTELLEKALSIDPTEIKAVVLMGVAQYHAGNLPRALSLLRKAVAGLGEDSPDGQQIATVIARIESEAGAAGAPGKTAAAAPAAKAAPAPAAKSGASVSGSVTIDEAMRKSVPAGAVLFVSARLPQGPRIPLAAVRLAAGQWPLPFELSDAQAMDPSRLLSSATQVVIDAHVSTTGSPMRQSGDVFGTSAPVKPGARDVAVKIDQRVP